MKSNSLSKEFAIIGILTFFLLALIFSFTSCSKNNDIEQVENINRLHSVQTSQINWIGHWLNEGNKVELVRDVAREFEFMNQEYLVNLKFPEEVYLNKNMGDLEFIVSQLQKDKPDWDIVRLYGNFEEIGKRLGDPNWADKYLVDFSEVPSFMESHKDFLKSDLYKSRNNEKFFGPHTEGQMAALFVNKKIAQKIGIEVKQFGMTFDDFLSYIKAAFEYNKSNSDIVPIFEYNWAKTQTIFNVLFYSLMNGDKDLLKTKLSATKLDAIKKCLLAFEELSKYNPIEDDWYLNDWTSENSSILYEKCLFFPNMTFMYGIWEQGNKELMNNVIPCEFPVFQPSSVYIGGYLSNWAVLKKSPNREQAVKLLMHWTRSDIAERWVRLSKSPSGVKGNVASSSFGYDPYENYTHTMDQKYKTFVRDEDRAFIVGQDNMHLSLRLQEILLGNVSAEEVFNEFSSLAVI